MQEQLPAPVCSTSEKQLPASLQLTCAKHMGPGAQSSVFSCVSKPVPTPVPCDASGRVTFMSTCRNKHNQGRGHALVPQISFNATAKEPQYFCQQ